MGGYSISCAGEPWTPRKSRSLEELDRMHAYAHDRFMKAESDSCAEVFWMTQATRLNREIINGRYRQSSSQVYSSSLGQPGSSAGAFPQAAYTASATAIQSAYSQYAAQQAAVRSAHYTRLAGQLLSGACLDLPGRPVERASPQVGEIIAWRAWDLKHGWLYSLTADHEWTPGEVEKAHAVSESFGEGIHAFKRRIDAIEYCNLGGAVGQVALWGEVVEFDKGWHAEFARVHSIDGLRRDIGEYGWFGKRRRRRRLEALRRTYGV